MTDKAPEAGIGFIGGGAWCHFRASDGTVLEIIGPDRAAPVGRE